MGIFSRMFGKTTYLTLFLGDSTCETHLQVDGYIRKSRGYSGTRAVGSAAQ